MSLNEIKVYFFAAFLVALIFPDDFIRQFYKSEAHFCGIVDDYYYKSTFRGRGKNGNIILVNNGQENLQIFVDSAHIKRKVIFSHGSKGMKICINYLTSPTKIGREFILTLVLDNKILLDKDYSLAELDHMTRFTKYVSPIALLFCAFFAFLMIRRKFK